MPIEAVATSETPSSNDESEANPETNTQATPAKTRRDSAKAYQTGFADGNHDPQVFESNFVPIDHATCASCHQSTAASDSCLNCHTYHVDPARLLGVHASTVVAPDTATDTTTSKAVD